MGGFDCSGVLIPLMPEGVEHPREGEWPYNTIEVLIPLMPEGVEHLNRLTEAEARAYVLIPLMPEGGEHTTLYILSACGLSRAYSSDAGRR